MASCLLVILNFYLVALKTSMFLSYFAVSSFAPAGFSSKTTYFAFAYKSGNLTPLKY